MPLQKIQGKNQRKIRMQDNIFSHDHFNTWQLCSKRYYFKYIKKLNWPDFSRDYEFGRKIHALIDYHLRGLEVDHLLKEESDELLKCWKILKNSYILNKKLIKTEWAFNTRIADTKNWLVGRIDAIFYDPSTKKYIITDWKTGKYVPKNIDKNFQHKVYLYALYNSQKDLGLDFKQEELEFQYIKVKDGITVNVVKFSKENEIEYQNMFTSIIKNIDAFTNFEKQEFCPLKQCNYQTLC